MKPLQLVVRTIKEIPSLIMVKHLNTICSPLKNISDAKFCAYSYINSLIADLLEESTNPHFFDKNLEPHYNNFFLQIYKYSHHKLQTKHEKRWKIIESFREQATILANKVKWEQENRLDFVNPHKTFFDTLNSFWLSGVGLWDCLI